MKSAVSGLSLRRDRSASSTSKGLPSAARRARRAAEETEDMAIASGHRCLIQSTDVLLLDSGRMEVTNRRGVVTSWWKTGACSIHSTTTTRSSCPAPTNRPR